MGKALKNKAQFRKILSKNKKIGLDSNIFIYFLDDEKKYSGLLELLFRNIERGKNFAFTSNLSYLETAAPSMKNKDLVELANIKNFFMTFPNLKSLAPEWSILDKAIY